MLASPPLAAGAAAPAGCSSGQPAALSPVQAEAAGSDEGDACWDGLLSESASPSAAGASSSAATPAAGGISGQAEPTQQAEAASTDEDAATAAGQQGGEPLEEKQQQQPQQPQQQHPGGRGLLYFEGARLVTRSNCPKVLHGKALAALGESHVKLLEVPLAVQQLPALKLCRLLLDSKSTKRPKGLVLVFELLPHPSRPLPGRDDLLRDTKHNQSYLQNAPACCDKAFSGCRYFSILLPTNASAPAEAAAAEAAVAWMKLVLGSSGVGSVPVVPGDREPQRQTILQLLKVLVHLAWRLQDCGVSAALPAWLQDELQLGSGATGDHHHLQQQQAAGLGQALQAGAAVSGHRL